MMAAVKTNSASDLCKKTRRTFARAGEHRWFDCEAEDGKFAG